MSATLEAPAYKTYEEGKFVVYEDVPVWKEHVSRLVGIKFGPRELEKVAARCNERINETGDYSPIVLRHTKDDGEVPPVVGFAGPFRIGRIGKTKPLTAILARMRFFKSEMDRVDRHPRVSVEYWFSKGDPTSGFFDPISLLGAETPELDLGLRYSRRQQAGAKLGMAVARYSVVANFGTTSSSLERNRTMVTAMEDVRLTPTDEGILRNAIDRIIDAELATVRQAKFAKALGRKTALPRGYEPVSVAVDTRPDYVRRGEMARYEANCLLNAKMIAQIIQALRPIVREMLMEVTPAPQVDQDRSNAVSPEKRQEMFNAALDAIRTTPRGGHHDLAQPDDMHPDVIHGFGRGGNTFAGGTANDARKKYAKQAAQDVYLARQRGEELAYADALRATYAAHGEELPAGA